MGTDERYNGWANRETWAVSLYLNNDQTWQEDVLDRVSESGEDDPFRVGEIVREWVEETLCAAVAEGFADRDTRMAIMDMGSLWRVDWREVGASFLEDVS